ncbi:MAG: flavodoxin family protein [Gaiellaceae bacterium]
MRALVVYESIFGNTRLVAEAVAAGLSSALDVDVVEVAAAPASFDGVELVVVGGPTHAFGMSRQRTREDGRRQGAESGHEVTSTGIGLREWLEAVRGTGTAAAAFDTRVAKPRLPGSAARGADKRLRSRGFRPVARPESFWVSGTFGPLRDGEVERAHRWGEQLAAAAADTGQGART